MSRQLSKAAITASIALSLVLSSCNKVHDLINHNEQERSILFVSNRDGNDEIYAMKLDGSDVVRLTNNSVQDGRATWSSNGKHIAFASGAVGSRDIYVMNADGSGLHNITNTPAADEDWPEWAPYGKQVIFSSNRDGNHEIYLINLETSHLQRLTFRPEDDKWPTYSHDGLRIAFQSDLRGTVGTEVFVMHANGTNVIRLTTSNGLDQMPAWSPDQTKLAFLSTRDGNPEIYVMDADGTNQTRLTNHPGVDARPSWSREGNYIVFTSSRDFELPGTLPKFEIYRMKGDGSNQIRLTKNELYDDFPFIKKYPNRNVKEIGKY